MNLKAIIDREIEELLKDPEIKDWYDRVNAEKQAEENLAKKLFIMNSVSKPEKTQSIKSNLNWIPQKPTAKGPWDKVFFIKDQEYAELQQFVSSDGNPYKSKFKDGYGYFLTKGGIGRRAIKDIQLTPAEKAAQLIYSCQS